MTADLQLAPVDPDRPPAARLLHRLEGPGGRAGREVRGGGESSLTEPHRAAPQSRVSLVRPGRDHPHRQAVVGPVVLQLLQAQAEPPALPLPPHLRRQLLLPLLLAGHVVGLVLGVPGGPDHQQGLLLVLVTDGDLLVQTGREAAQFSGRGVAQTEAGLARSGETDLLRGAGPD